MDGSVFAPKRFSAPFAAKQSVISIHGRVPVICLARKSPMAQRVTWLEDKRSVADAAGVAQTVCLLYRRLPACEMCGVVRALRIANPRHSRLPVCATNYGHPSLIVRKMSAIASAFGSAVHSRPNR